jgi:hypothetical protein
LVSVPHCAISIVTKRTFPSRSGGIKIVLRSSALVVIARSVTVVCRHRRPILFAQPFRSRLLWLVHDVEVCYSEKGKRSDRRDAFVRFGGATLHCDYNMAPGDAPNVRYVLAGTYRYPVIQVTYGSQYGISGSQYQLYCTTGMRCNNDLLQTSYFFIARTYCILYTSESRFVKSYARRTIPYSKGIIVVSREKRPNDCCEGTAPCHTIDMTA